MLRKVNSRKGKTLKVFNLSNENGIFILNRRMLKFEKFHHSSKDYMVLLYMSFFKKRSHISALGMYVL